MYGFFSALTRIGAVVGFIVLIVGLYSAKSAPQEAAAAAVALALAVLPYVFFKTVQAKYDADDANAFRFEALAKLSALAASSDQS